tara:strand:- start:763 stop:1800 length:1038 start_codon:yes stop_codon:yes gene_type:complete
MRLLFFLFILLITNHIHAQGCCSGGSGIPIAGGAATGVLKQHQMEVSGNYQYIRSNKFYTENRDTAALFDHLNSSYIFLRTDYGLTDKLTLSIAGGYFSGKSLVELEQTDTVSSSGFGDLIIFPRFDVYNKTKNKKQTEITIGLGLKIPLGSHSDSNLVFSHPIAGDFYTISPPTVQPTNGSYDMMFYSFFFRSYQKRKFRVFANTFYFKRGYNSLGQKFGDYASIGVFASKTFFRKIGVTGQLKGEWIGEMKAARNIDLLASYNIDQISTGSRKLFFVPQVSFIQKSMIFYITNEIPLYQFVNGTQIGSQHQITFGFNYRFMLKKGNDVLEDCELEEPQGNTIE